MRATSARRRTQTQERRAERQQLLLDTVEALLEDRSYRDLTVEDVMLEAGLSRTTFYRYFPDLESILVAGISQVGGEILVASQRWYDAVGDPGALEAAAAGLVDAYRRHGRLLLAFADAAATAPAVEQAWQQTIDGFVERTTERIQHLRRNGGSQVAHPREVARALVWMTERYLLETYGRGGTLPSRTAVEVIAGIWRRTLFD